MALVTDQPEGLPTTNALDQLPIQQALIEASFVKFTGTSGEPLDGVPGVDEERTYIVKAVCKGYDVRKRADHENRVVAVMEITSCHERGKVPIVDESQPSLYSVPDNADESEGGDPE